MLNSEVGKITTIIWHNLWDENALFMGFLREQACEKNYLARFRDVFERFLNESAGYSLEGIRVTIPDFTKASLAFVSSMSGARSS